MMIIVISVILVFHLKTKVIIKNILNWNKTIGKKDIGIDFKAKEYVEKNNKCPDYLIVKANDGFDLDGYQLHAADTEEYASQLQSYLSGTRYIAKNKNMTYDEQEIELAKENIQKEIDNINTTINEYDLSKCKDEDKVITRIAECNDIINAFKSRLSTYIENVDGYVRQGLLNESDDLVKEFQEKVTNAQTFLDKEQKVLDEEDKKIKEELGLTDKDDDDYKQEWIPETLCGENGEYCNIDVTKFCNDPYVARTLKFLGLLLAIAKILVPAIIIVLGIVDLVKIVVSGKVEDAKKQAINIGKRIVIGVMIFLLPTIIIMIYNIADNIANDKGEITPSEELNVPDNFKNCVYCILDANNKDACMINEKK